jgi:Tol biopolymer transport system component
MRRTVVSSAFVLVLLALLAGAGGALAAPAQRASVPEGQRLLLARASDWSHPSHIWSVAADGSGLRRLTPSRSNDYAPAWSPDHTSIAYIHDGRGPATLWRMDADGSHRRRIRYSGPSLATATSALAWSPDGRSIAGGCRLGKILRVAVTVLDLSTGRSRRLMTYPYYTKVTSLDWSSDSSRLLVCGMNADPGWVDVLDVASGDVSSMGATAYSAAWSPDGTRFLVSAFMDDSSGLWPPDQYQVELRDEYGDYVTTLYGDEQSWCGPCAYSPDGAQCAYAASDNRHGHIYVQAADGSQPPTAILSWKKGLVGGVAWK